MVDEIKREVLAELRLVLGYVYMHMTDFDFYAKSADEAYENIKRNILNRIEYIEGKTICRITSEVILSKEDLLFQLGTVTRSVDGKEPHYPKWEVYEINQLQEILDRVKNKKTE